VADIVHDTVTLPDGTVGVAYEAALAYHGNASALSASSVSSGALPPGLVLDTALPFDRISGTPTTGGTYTFKVTLTDAAGGVQSGFLSIRVETEGIDQDDNLSAAAAVKIEWPLS
jgi:Putative Ig domain